ncbi:unnamed protein product [Prorocentrum cordatum]|uniref:Uncharacterized protein n=1 Tax=Prorocentrum cordatum TaxID=2364126 RepID=A0ABN9SM64_9DINO|nr:unnamed protein product [Polarella glacialis]
MAPLRSRAHWGSRARLAVALQAGVAALRDCDGVVEDGISWDVVREDLGHIVRQVREGALERDLHASKDSGGRDPLVSYGDVALQRHLERFQDLAALLGGHRRCSLGRQTVQLLMSVLFSGLPWGAWFERHRLDLDGLLHDASWAEAAESGWPVLEVLSVIGALVQSSRGPPGCREVDLEGLDALVGGASAGSPVPAAAEELLGRPACAFAQGVALGVSAAASANRSAAARLLARAQARLRQAVAAEGPGVAPWALFSRPLPELLQRLARTWESFGATAAPRQTDILYCGHLDIEEQLQGLCDHAGCSARVRLTESASETRTACAAFYRDAVLALAPASTERASTLIVSPLTWQWREELRDDLRLLLREQDRWRSKIPWAGVPCVNSSRVWNWPVRRARHRFWKLDFEEYATGYETSQYLPIAEFWVVGDTSSGTRVYSTAALREVSAELRRREQDYPAALPGGDAPLEPPEDAATWLVELDLAGKALGLRAHTLLQAVSLEDEYKARASLSARLARTFHIEAARFLPASPQQERCLFPTTRSAAGFVADHGVVCSWCTRKRLCDMFQAVGGWWLGIAPLSHIIVPVSASVLNVFRSGASDLFPWDADIDANFIADHPLVVGSYLEERRDALEALGYSYILRGDRLSLPRCSTTSRTPCGWTSGSLGPRTCAPTTSALGCAACA